jgi:hypothetical protein
MSLLSSRTLTLVLGVALAVIAFVLVLGMYRLDMRATPPISPPPSLGI